MWIVYLAVAFVVLVFGAISLFALETETKSNEQHQRKPTL
jgi:hypothetical protein